MKSGTLILTTMQSNFVYNNKIGYSVKDLKQTMPNLSIHLSMITKTVVKIKVQIMQTLEVEQKRRMIKT